MIPQQLILKNFLSYRQASLDFSGLHTACICGANGAGKSSLLEAITWVIWGKSRANSEDDLINSGEKNVRVDFTFISNNQTYRIIRSRQRGRSSVVEFQIQTESGKFRALSGKGKKVNQEQIIKYLKLDYDTFINSSYLRQGRADEFMLRRPNERKKVLADLLKLDQYEKLAKQANEASKEYKGQAQQLEGSLQPLQAKLAKREEILSIKADVETQTQQLQKQQEITKEKLQQLQGVEHQRQTWQKQITWQQTQYQNLTQDCLRLEKEINTNQSQLQELAKWLNQSETITSGYENLQRLRQEEESFAAKFQTNQDLHQEKQQLENQLNQEVNQINLAIRQSTARLEALTQQEQEIQETLSRADEIAHALETLSQHRQNLQYLDDLQLQVSPLLQRRQTLHTQLETTQARLTARLEQLHTSAQQLSSQISTVPQVRDSAVAVATRIEELEKKRVYQQRVTEKGQEKKGFLERLQESQRNCEEQIEELRQKLDILQNPSAVCPLCEQNLDEHHRHQVVQKTHTQQEEIQNHVWVIKEQIATCERELNLLRKEYAQLRSELDIYDGLMQQKGQLEARLSASVEVQQRLEAITQEKQELERSLSMGSYALELQAELQVLNQDLEQLNYDEQTHALVRKEVDNWRWAEIKQAKIDEAKRRQLAIDTQKPEILAEIASLEAAITQLQGNSPLQQQIASVESQITALGYDRSHHQALTQALREAQPWQLSYQQLQQAQQQYPQLEARITQLEASVQTRLQDKQGMEKQLEEMTAQINNIADNRQEIATLEEQIHHRRHQLDNFLAQQGSLNQQLTHLDELQTQYQATSEQLKQAQKQHRVYHELAQAFGKNGIQALMIENILPQLEAETNQILARLTGNQLHVQFLTQKAGKSSRSRKKDSKLIDTLEILIADAQGTRAYETYSGGEAFRINFAIRLALAKLLAQRAGTALQMLIVDEGFGTQDGEGCDRLIAAINAISSDFSCILTVTHMPQFKEAFQTRIEVHKTNQGSQLVLSS